MNPAQPLYDLPARIAAEGGSLVSEIAPACFGLIALWVIVSLTRRLVWEGAR